LSISEDNTYLISAYDSFFTLYKTFLLPLPSESFLGYADGNFAGSWTDKTLTRIDVIIDTLKGMGIGMGWSDKTLSRIDDILSQLKGMGDEIAGGWTDKTLNRIEIIMDTLKDMGNGVILTDKDIEY
jgi:ribosome assembly protein YihI (activator of Der GTPase)